MIGSVSLETPIEQIPFIGPAYGSRLFKLDIQTAVDLLFHIPFRYEDYSLVLPIDSLQEGERVSVNGIIQSVKNSYTKSHISIQKAVIADATGELVVTWYNQPYLVNSLRVGARIALAGLVNRNFSSQFAMEMPDFETIIPGKPLIHTNRLVPIYPETHGVSSKWLRSRIFPLLQSLTAQLEEYIPNRILDEFHLLGISKAFEMCHFPQTLDEARMGKRRICFDELLILQLSAVIRRNAWNNRTNGIHFSKQKFSKELESFKNSLPFTLTPSQLRSVDEILNDMSLIRPMNRLLQGDVGSGKTIVSSFAILLAHLHEYAVAFMAPTEILARQHFETLSKLFQPLGISCALRTSKTKEGNGDATVVIGTHALLSKKLKMKNLGLVIIDEQQRFGVAQRALLSKKGKNPHILSLTATPIPRTIALTLYADLDVSIIDELPHGRLKIKTYVINESKRDAAYAWIRKKIQESNGREQVYIVCPLIEESDTLESVKAAKSEFTTLSQTVFKDLKLGLLHGKLKSGEKDSILSKFRNGEIHILVATPVVEVGIDIPTATIMLVEAAERFGLSQLHQLRGRVGRGTIASYCILSTNSDNTKAIERLKLLETIDQGHVLAEYDLKLRGQGDLFGTAQHGSLGLRYADMQDITLIKTAHTAALLLLSTDPDLKKSPPLRKMLQKYTIKDIVDN